MCYVCVQNVLNDVCAGVLVLLREVAASVLPGAGEFTSFYLCLATIIKYTKLDTC